MKILNYNIYHYYGEDKERKWYVCIAFQPSEDDEVAWECYYIHELKECISELDDILLKLMQES